MQLELRDTRVNKMGNPQEGLVKYKVRCLGNTESGLDDSWPLTALGADRLGSPAHLRSETSVSSHRAHIPLSVTAVTLFPLHRISTLDP